MWRRLLWIGTLALGATLLSSPILAREKKDDRRSSQKDDLDISSEIYNEIIDERPEDQKISPAERDKRLVDQLGRQLRQTLGEKEKQQQPPQQQQILVVPPAQAPGEAEGQTEGAADRRRRPPQPAGAVPVVAPGEAQPGAPAPVTPETPAQLENRPTLGIHPPSWIMAVDEQKEFLIRLDNPERAAYDAIGFVIRYDPSALEVLDALPEMSGVNIFDASAAALGFEISPHNRYYRNEVDAGQGLVIFQARIPATQSFAHKDGLVARFTVRALQERGKTSLEFINVLSGEAIDEALKKPGGAQATFLRMFDKDNRDNVFEYPILKFGAEVKILPSAQDEFVAATQREFYPLALRLEPERGQVRVGEEFDVYVSLDNPERLPFDSVSLYLRYDPRVLQVVDTDENNWITQGVNIHDGDFRDSFPFEIFGANTVDLDKGMIRYSMESFREPINASGRFARIRLKALRPVELTSLLYGFNLPGKKPTTGVFRRGQDILAKTEEPRDGVYSEAISILP